jgi:hypothetical protein
LLTYGGSLSGNLPAIGALPSGYNVSVNTNTLGQVKLVVQAVPANSPVFGGVTIAGGKLTLSGSGGTKNGMYYVLASTNLTLPLAQWQAIATNQCDASGCFTVTNLIFNNAPQRFYLLQSQ